MREFINWKAEETNTRFQPELKTGIFKALLQKEGSFNDNSSVPKNRYMTVIDEKENLFFLEASDTVRA